MDQKNAPKGGKQGASLAAELQRRLHAASQQHHESHRVLHQAVCAYLDELRVSGVPREDALEAVREFVAQARDRGAAGLPKAPTHVNERLIDQIADWSEAHWRESA